MISLKNQKEKIYAISKFPRKNSTPGDDEAKATLLTGLYVLVSEATSWLVSVDGCAGDPAKTSDQNNFQQRANAPDRTTICRIKVSGCETGVLQRSPKILYKKQDA